MVLVGAFLQQASDLEPYFGDASLTVDSLARDDVEGFDVAGVDRGALRALERARVQLVGPPLCEDQPHGPFGSVRVEPVQVQYIVFSCKPQSSQQELFLVLLEAQSII